MLGDLERKLAAIVADSVAARPHLAVSVAPLAAPAPGRGTVAVGLATITADTGFTPFDTAATGTPDAPRSRRVLPIAFTAAIGFALRPTDATPAAQADARALILDDMSAVAHRLGDATLRTGAGFAVAAPDPGFLVSGFQLDGGVVAATLDAGNYAAALTYRGEASVWPVGVARDEGVIATIDRLIEPLPLAFGVAAAGVAPGATTSVTVALGRLLRLRDDGTRAPTPLAVSVLADVPIAARGTVPAGVDGLETGVRIVPGDVPGDAPSGTVTIPYQAPAGDPGPAGRTEYLAVHLATPEGGTGLFLGSVAIRLVPAP